MSAIIFLPDKLVNSRPSARQSKPSLFLRKRVPAACVTSSSADTPFALSVKGSGHRSGPEPSLRVPTSRTGGSPAFRARPSSSISLPDSSSVQRDSPLERTARRVDFHVAENSGDRRRGSIEGDGTPNRPRSAVAGLSRLIIPSPSRESRPLSVVDSDSTPRRPPRSAGVRRVLSARERIVEHSPSMIVKTSLNDREVQLLFTMNIDRAILTVFFPTEAQLEICFERFRRIPKTHVAREHHLCSQRQWMV